MGGRTLLRQHQAMKTRARGMLACPVCHMVLSASGNCPLCGSAVQDDERPELSHAATPEVGIPFGLGEATQSEELSPLPCGIDDAPESPPQSIQEPHNPSSRSNLPFGIDDAPSVSSATFLESESESDPLIEPNSSPLLFGLDSAPSENIENSEENAPVESRNPSLKLPYGIDHMHHTPID